MKKETWISSLGPCTSQTGMIAGALMSGCNDLFVFFRMPLLLACRGVQIFMIGKKTV